MGTSNQKRKAKEQTQPEKETEKNVHNLQYKPEKQIDKHANPVNGEQYEKITDQMKMNLCKIDSNGGFGSGFFCKIPFPDENIMLRVLITSNHILNENNIKNGETIKFSLQNNQIEKKIIIDNTRKTYTNKELDTTIIEIKPTDEINSFLEIDEKLYKKNTKKKEEIYIIQYSKDKKYSFSTGKIHQFNKNNIENYCITGEESSGSPIFYLSNFKVIGIHKEKKNERNIATLITTPIKEFNNKFQSSKVTIMVKIEKNDVGKKINFLGFNEALNYYKNEISDSNCSEKMKGEYNKLIKDIEEQLLEINKNNVILIINNKEEEFKTYFIPNKNGDYKIQLIFNVKLKNCAGMFWDCFNLIDIDLSEFDTQNVCNMYEMFSGCSNLTKIDFSNFKTENVTNMAYMFGGDNENECSSTENANFMAFITNSSDDSEKKSSRKIKIGCSSLKTLDLSSFKTENVTNMKNMFEGCFCLQSLSLNNFNTQNVTDMGSMFYNCAL